MQEVRRTIKYKEYEATVYDLSTRQNYYLRIKLAGRWSVTETRKALDLQPHEKIVSVTETGNETKKTYAMPLDEFIKQSREIKGE